MGAALIGTVVLLHRTPEQKEARYLKRGNDLFEKGEYGKARLEYRNAARVMPADANVYYRMGLVDEAEGDISSAFGDFSFAELQNAHCDPALLKLAGYYLITEKYDEAQKRVDTVLHDEPGNLEAQALHASLLLHRKDISGAKKEAQAVLDKDPGNITAISVLVGVYFTQGDEAMAVKTLEDGIVRNPKEISLLMLKAHLYAQTNNVAKVSEAYQAMFRLRPKDEKLRMDLADILIEAKQFDNAEAVLRAGAAALPDDWDMKHRLILFLNDHRNADAAEKEIRGYMKAYPKNTDLYFWLVDLYMRNHATDRAIALLNEVIAKEPEGGEALNARASLARVHFIKGDKALADKMVAAILAKDPGNPEALLIQANMEFDQGLYSNAVSNLRTILHEQPRNMDALHLLAETLLRQGRTDLAIDTLNQLLDIDPLNSAVRVRLAQMYNLNGDSQRALELLSIVNKSDPNYAIGWESTARVAMSANDLAKAESAINILSSMDGQQMTSVFLEGRILAGTGKKAEAITDYTRVINADPASPLAEHALSSLVGLYESMGQLEKAVSYMEGLRSSSAYINTLLGECYVKLGKTDKGAAAFDRAIAAGVTSQDPYLDRADLYIKDHKDDLAIAVLKKAEEAVPGDVRAPMMEAYTLQHTGHYQEAIDIYSTIMKNNPGFTVAANNLAAVIAEYDYNDSVMLEKARKIAEQFIGSSDPVMLDTLAWIYYHQGNYNQAQLLVNQAKASGTPVSPEIHYHFGAILLKSGDDKGAKAELQQAVVSGADYYGLDEAKKMLNGL